MIITEQRILWTYDDGGRAAAGFTGEAGDCVTRSIAIAAELPYRTVYDDMNRLTLPIRAEGLATGARSGIPRKVYDPYLAELGWEWTPTMQIGSGATVHLRASELPAGRLIVRLSKHLAAVIDRVVHDTHDPSRGGNRCVYGYWRKL